MTCTPDSSSIPYTVAYDSGVGASYITGSRSGTTRKYNVLDIKNKTSVHVLYVATKAPNQTRTVYLAFDYSGKGDDVSAIRTIDGASDKKDKCVFIPSQVVAQVAPPQTDFEFDKFSAMERRGLAVQQENVRLLQENNTRLREENTRLQQEAQTKAAQTPYRPTVTCADGFDIFGENREGMCSNHGGVKQSATPVASLGTARRDDNTNVDEAGFISVINDARIEYNNGSNDMAKGAARVNRRDHLCQLVKSMAVQGWTGTIVELSSSSSGKGVLVVSIGPKITIRTTNNEFSDSINHTLLSPSSNVFRQAVSLSKDQRIVFSGSFLSGDTDCVQETSLTQEGSMTDPEFQFLFTDVRAP